MTFLLLLLALGAGIANPFQSGTNAELNKQLASPVWAGIIVYASGLAGLLLYQLLSRGHALDPAKLAAVPWWAWLGGLVSIVSTVIGLTIAQKLGSGVFTGASITPRL